MKARPVLGLVVAQSSAYAGTRLAMIALPWFVLQTTGSPADGSAVPEAGPVIRNACGPAGPRCGVGGFGSGFLNPILSVVILERLPRHVIGRGMAMTGALTRLGVPLGAPVLGALVGIAGTAPVLLGSALAYALVAAVPANRRVRAGIARGSPGSEEGPVGPPWVDRAD